jgi:hypothetical protein
METRAGSAWAGAAGEPPAPLLVEARRAGSRGTLPPLVGSGNPPRLHARMLETFGGVPASCGECDERGGLFNLK